MRGMGGLSLGELIDKLKARPKDETVRYDFCGFVPTRLHSYRGYYEDLALGYASPSAPTDNECSVADLLVRLEMAVGKVFTGYKGGDYVMDRGVPVWVSPHNESWGTAITDVADGGYCTVLVTEKRD